MVRAHEKAVRMNKRNILSLLEPSSSRNFVDLGCLDGAWTKELAGRALAGEFYGVDLDKAAGKKASERGVSFVLADLNRNLPFEDDCVDVVHSNQVIEHLENVDTFVEEIFRILRPGGYAILSTENISSIDNIVAMLLGQQAFSQHISARVHIGNRFSPHFGKKVTDPLSVHRTIFSYHGLIQLLQSYGFLVESVLGAGYPPLPSAIARLDPVHSRFITTKARKPKG